MVNPYEYQPETKWYHVLWDLRNAEFRQWWIKHKRRHMRMFFKYESHRFWESAGLGLLFACAFLYVCGTDTMIALVRWPTEDPNELMKQKVWQKHRNELNERKDRASKMLEDSNYIHQKNKPIE